MYSWTCPRCKTDNSETGTCVKCEHVATRGELRHARRLHYTRSRYPRGLPPLPTSSPVPGLLTTLFFVAATGLLVVLVPGAATAKVIVPATSSTTIAVTKKSRVKVSAIVVPQRTGVLHLLDPLAGSRAYIVMAGSPVLRSLSTSSVSYKLTTKKAQGVGAASANGTGPAAGFILRSVDGSSVLTLPIDVEAGPWSGVLASGKDQKKVTATLVAVETPLRSNTWSWLTIFLGALGFAAIGYFTTGRAAARQLLSCVAAVLTTIAGLRAIEALVSRLIGRYAIDSQYPHTVVILIPVVAGIILLVLVLVVYRAVEDRVAFLNTESEVTAYSWRLSKLIGVAAVPLLAYVVLRAVDLLVSSIAPGLNF